jgi:glycosyltransferase involved in cell wall biosynthesis
MLRAAYEAIYQGTPVIVSDWPLLRQAFDEGALHVNNSAASIAAAAASVAAGGEALRAGAARLRARKLARWAQTKAAISARLAGASPPRPVAEDERPKAVSL